MGSSLDKSFTAARLNSNRVELKTACMHNIRSHRSKHQALQLSVDPEKLRHAESIVRTLSASPLDFCRPHTAY